MNTTQAAAPGKAAVMSGQSRVWTMMPSRSVRRRALLVALPATIFAAAMAAILFHSVLAALGAAALVVITVGDRFVPLTFSLNDNGVSVRVGPLEWLEMPWTSVASISCIPGGLKLSPFENPATATLESRRGIRLAYRAEAAGEIEQIVLRYVRQSREPKL